MKWLRCVSLVIALTFFHSFNVSAQVWKVYRPASNNLLGCTVSSFTGNELATGQCISTDSYDTRTGTSQEFNEFKRGTNLQIFRIGVAGVRVTKLDVKGITYIDQLKPELLPLDIKVVYSGLRADNVEVTIKKDLNTDIDVEGFLTAVKEFGSKFDPNFSPIKSLTPQTQTSASSATPTSTPPATSTTSAKQTEKEILENARIKFNREKEIKFNINNANVYYSIQFATLRQDGISSRWQQTFNEGDLNNQRVITLNPEVGRNESRSVTPRGDNGSIPVAVSLRVEKDNAGRVQLYFVKGSEPPILIPRNVLGNTAWSYNSHFVKTYQTRTNRFKLLLLDIRASETRDGGVLITSSSLSYPDAKLEIDR